MCQPYIERVALADNHRCVIYKQASQTKREGGGVVDEEEEEETKQQQPTT